MKLTENKWYRALGFVMLPLGLFLVAAGLMAQGKSGGAVPWVKLGPVGLMLFVGGVGLLFLPSKIKF